MDYDSSSVCLTPGWDEYLLATGTCNHWMVISKCQAIGCDGNWWGSNQHRQVLRRRAYLYCLFISAPTWYMDSDSPYSRTHGDGV